MSPTRKPRHFVVILLLSAIFMLPLSGCNAGKVDMLQTTTKLNQTFAFAEKETADAIRAGILPASIHKTIDPSVMAARRFLDQMGIDARADDTVSWMTTLKEFTVAVAPLLTQQAALAPPAK